MLSRVDTRNSSVSLTDQSSVSQSGIDDTWPATALQSYTLIMQHCVKYKVALKRSVLRNQNGDFLVRFGELTACENQEEWLKPSIFNIFTSCGFRMLVGVTFKLLVEYFRNHQIQSKCCRIIFIQWSHTHTHTLIKSSVTLDKDYGNI